MAAILLLIVAVSLKADAVETQTFSRAKTLASKYIFTDDFRVDIYCGCKYTEKGKIDWKSCGYQPRRNPKRGARLEWEHVVPAYHLGRYMSCWKEGRAACERQSPDFQKREGDLHNLRPSVGELNADRSNKLYGSVSNQEAGFVGGISRHSGLYGRCDFHVGHGRVQPPRNVWGDVSRITLYMNEKYKLELPNDYIDLMKEWDKLDPVDDKEKEINRRIESIQGDSNPFIEQPR